MGDSIQASCRIWRPVHVLDIEVRDLDDRALIAHLAAKGDPVFYALCAGCDTRICSLQSSCNNSEPFKYYCVECAGDYGIDALNTPAECYADCDDPMCPYTH